MKPAPQEPIRLGGKATEGRIDDLSRRVADLEVQDSRLSALERRVAELERRIVPRPDPRPPVEKITFDGRAA